MTKAPTQDEDRTNTILREMAQDMGVAQYRRYDETEAAKIVGIPKGDLAALRRRGEIAYLLIGDGHVGFLGRHLLTYLLECVVPAGEASPPKGAPDEQPSPRPQTPSPDAELVSVNETLALLGIGRTKLYELLNADTLASVKIGRRTLIRRESVRRLIEASGGE